MTSLGENNRSPLPYPSGRSSPLKFLVSSSAAKPDTSKEAHKAWEREYLKDLRSYRPSRPNGSRPLPHQNDSATRIDIGNYTRQSSVLTAEMSDLQQRSPTEMFERNHSSSTLSHRRASPTKPQASLGVSKKSEQLEYLVNEDPKSNEQAGRPLIRQPPRRRSESGNQFIHSIAPSGTYQERTQRVIEKQEARSLREALEAMDLDEEARLYTAAQDEASELVWRHKYPNVPYQNPDSKYRYKSHSEYHAHGRYQINDHRGASGDFLDATPLGQTSPTQESLPDMSLSDWPANGEQNNAAHIVEALEEKNPPARVVHTHTRSQTAPVGHALWDSPEKKSYTNLAFSIPRVKSSGRRRSSGTRLRNTSGSLFRNPDDRIYEEPNEVEKACELTTCNPIKEGSPLSSTNTNPTSRSSRAGHVHSRSMTDPAESVSKISKTEIHRNRPSQSRNPVYTRNILPPTPAELTNTTRERPCQDEASANQGIEIRSDDIRAATSMRLKDRSPKLPMPTVVSDSHGRPIVSFDRNWRRHSGENKDSFYSERLPQDKAKPLPVTVRFNPQSHTSRTPTITLQGTGVTDHSSDHTGEVAKPPSVRFSSVPSIAVSASDIPTISVSDDQTTTRPLPTPSNKHEVALSGRPLPKHSSSAPITRPLRHWSPAFHHRPTAQCAACALPISGRIVSAASQRFHPECFTCFHCHEQLECVAFYPEPDAFRNERLARIEARANGEIGEEAGKLGDDDGDDSLRFYCHLDFHEKFSPRCRSCKTPIEGEVVVACGGQWHVGHFFCAQCGDPFDSNTPFIEKDGYAWCVGCHTNRFSGKCRGCKKPVINLVECGGPFEDGRFFTRDDEETPVCVGCEERRLKA
ncbi:MAG: hypothetical protein LQ351_002990 [Letrouitia transgressa]|nr:MAG: hypothetical protein LQ351_002990 [Letrouitia transgressa]